VNRSAWIIILISIATIFAIVALGGKRR